MGKGCLSQFAQKPAWAGSGPALRMDLPGRGIKRRAMYISSLESGVYGNIVIKIYPR